MIDEEAGLAADEKYLLQIFRQLLPGGKKIVLGYSEDLLVKEQIMLGKAEDASDAGYGKLVNILKNDPTKSAEASQEAISQENIA